MFETAFAEIVDKICMEDARYHPESYYFVREALDFTARTLKKPSQGNQRHVSGHELLEGIRTYALQEYGPLTYTVLKTWGVTCTEDFGKVVFHLVNAGVLGKTDRDQQEDFSGSYSFEEAFVQPYLPRTPLENDLSEKKNPSKKKKNSSS